MAWLSAVFNCLFYAVVIYTAAISTYILMISILSFFFKKKRVLSSTLPSIAVVIPAHNEEDLIETTIRSIQESDYPQELLQIHVIADNCTDATAELSRATGAAVLVRTNKEQIGKGAALSAFLESQATLLDTVEAVTIIDADTEVDPLFFWEAASSIRHPEVDVVQGFYSTLRPTESWMSSIYRIAFLVSNHVRPAGRSVWSDSINLTGNGMTFCSDVLKKYGWPCNSLAEDLEMSLFLTQNGVRISYNPDAIVRGEMPTTAKQARSQRERWEWGRFQLWKPQLRKLFSAFWRSPRFAIIDAALDLFVPPLSALIFLASGAAILNSWFVHSTAIYIQLLLVAVSLTFYVATSLWQRRQPLLIWLALLSLPLYLVFKALLYAKMFIWRETTWLRTQRAVER